MCSRCIGAVFSSHIPSQSKIAPGKVCTKVPTLAAAAAATAASGHREPVGYSLMYRSFPIIL